MTAPSQQSVGKFYLLKANHEETDTVPADTCLVVHTAEDIP